MGRDLLSPIQKMGSGRELQAKMLGKDGQQVFVALDPARRNFASAPNAQLAVSQQAASFGGAKLHEQRLHEQRAGVRRDIVVRHLEVDRELRLERKGV